SSEGRGAGPRAAGRGSGPQPTVPDVHGLVGMAVMVERVHVAAADRRGSARACGRIRRQAGGQRSGDARMMGMMVAMVVAMVVVVVVVVMMQMGEEVIAHRL
ncbi:hypothetical protein Vretimale_15869, partial [Volvox reticuliferus]